MKRFAIVAAVLLATAAVYSSSARADTSGTASSQVTVQIVSNVSISPQLAVVPAGIVQPNGSTLVVAPVPFNVSANVQNLAFSVQASMLYKGDDPTSSNAIQLASAGADITATNANPYPGVQNTGLGFSSVQAGTLNGFPMFTTGTVDLESSVVDDFSQVVTATVRWLPDRKSVV